VSLRRLCAWSIIGASLSASGCSSLLGLSSLEKVDCLDDCGGGGLDSAGGGGSNNAAGNVEFGGASPQGGFPAVAGGFENDAGASTFSEAGAAGEPFGNACPGGPVPVASWKEHWFEHNQDLTRIYYDDCAVIYFDPDVNPAASAWLAPFVSNAWKYSVKTYGYLGPERVYAVFHQGHYGGGHMAMFYEDSHDFHSIEDMAANDWTQNYTDQVMILLGHIVERSAAHTKFGSPASAVWLNTPWSEFFEYDTLVGLGLNDQAAAAYNKYTKVALSFPRADSYWFRDWFYPLWRDHGHAQVMADFYALLEKYYPATDGQMPAMNWGEYIHFQSGSAHTNLKPLATAAFGWTPEWQDQFVQAEIAYPNITY